MFLPNDRLTKKKVWRLFFFPITFSRCSLLTFAIQTLMYAEEPWVGMAGNRGGERVLCSAWSEHQNTNNYIKRPDGKSDRMNDCTAQVEKMGFYGAVVQQISFPACARRCCAVSGACCCRLGQRSTHSAYITLCSSAGSAPAPAWLSVSDSGTWQHLLFLLWRHEGRGQILLRAGEGLEMSTRQNPLSCDGCYR